MIHKFALLILMSFVLNSHAQTALCPGRPMLSSVLYPAQNVTQQNRPENHYQAMLAAKLIYDYSDLDNNGIFTEKRNATGADVIQGLRRFTAGLPSNYAIFKIYGEPEAGLKYMILRPTDDASQPWILALAGTQSMLDWVVDMDLGRSQFEKLNSVLELFTTCNHMGPDGAPLPAREFIIAGHSLGGGLAQAFAYKVQALRTRAGLRPMRLQTVTFNAFGAKPLIEKYETFDPGIEALVNGTNYFVKEDIVSRIGTHIGVTRQLTPAGESPEVAVKIGISGIKERHFMAMVVSLSDQMPSAPSRSPRDFMLLQELAKLGGAALFFLHVLPRDNETYRVAQVLTAATNLFLAGGVTTAQDHQVRTLLAGIVRDRIREWDRPSNGLFANYAVADLRKIESRLNALRLDLVR